MTTECCLTCRYGVTNTNRPRECRRHAPTSLPDLMRTRKGGPRIYKTAWPLVLDVNWCGDYEGRGD